jgi:hypothetical protein
MRIRRVSAEVQLGGRGSVVRLPVVVRWVVQQRGDLIAVLRTAFWLENHTTRF